MPRLAGVVLALAVSIPAAASGPSPRDLVMEATARLMTALAVSGDQVRENPRLAYQLAGETVLPLVDFDRVGRRVLGKHWRRASPEQRAAYQREFREFATHFLVTAMVTYSRELASYADRLTYPKVHWSPGDERATVRMLVRLKGGLQAEVQYRMQLRGGRWQVQDVTLEGISLVLMYRDSFAHDIERHGLDGFIERMTARNRERPG